MKPPAQIKTVRKKIVALCTFLLLIGFAQTESSFAVDSGPTFKSVSSGEHFTCGLTTTGDVYCWGANENSQLGTSAVSANSTPNKVYQISNALEITSGRDFACARISDGGVACWGRGDLGQTGDGIETKIDRIFATRVHSINTAIGISAGASHACALLADKSVRCWGENQFFQLGNEKSKIESMPVVVTGIPPMQQITSGLNHTCALAESGFVFCWGDNKFGQLGIGTMQTLKALPSLVLGIKKVNKIQLGFDSSCASVETTGFTCWGQGVDGQLAETDRFNRSIPVPITLSTLTDSATALVSISLGRTKACGLLNSARSNLMYCWGSTVSTDPITGSSATSVSLGSDHGCIVTTTGTVRCWGWNHKGQLGLGTTSNNVSSISVVSGFPDWIYWINTWSIKFEDNLGILTWTGGTGKYIVTIAGKGIVCETLSGVKSCKFGPLDSDTLYTGTITAQNTPVSLSRTANLSFTTGKLVGALEQYALDQAATLKLVREKADIEKADSFIATLSKQISSATLLEAQAEASFLKSSKETDKYLETLATNDLIVKNTQDEIKKMTNVLKNLVLKILKKIGS
jgi:alpha-tubulin suppressor-like RCC1 family protein